MSLFSREDYERESKTNKVVSPRRASHGGIATSKKIKLPTQHKSPNHNCAHCTRKDAKKYKISTKEVRWLCPVCVIKNKNKNTQEKSNFISAKKFWRQNGIK